MLMMEWFRKTISNFDHNDNSQESDEHVVFDIFQFSFKSWILAWWFNNNWKVFDFTFLHLLVKIWLHER
jgi:hypothetical protein